MNLRGGRRSTVKRKCYRERERGFLGLLDVSGDATDGGTLGLEVLFEVMHLIGRLLCEKLDRKLFIALVELGLITNGSPQLEIPCVGRSC